MSLPNGTPRPGKKRRLSTGDAAIATNSQETDQLPDNVLNMKELVLTASQGIDSSIKSLESMGLTIPEAMRMAYGGPAPFPPRVQTYVSPVSDDRKAQDNSRPVLRGNSQRRNNPRGGKRRGGRRGRGKSRKRGGNGNNHPANGYESMSTRTKPHVAVVALRRCTNAIVAKVNSALNRVNLKPFTDKHGHQVYNPAELKAYKAAFRRCQRDLAWNMKPREKRIDLMKPDAPSHGKPTGVRADVIDRVVTPPKLDGAYLAVPEALRPQFIKDLSECLGLVHDWHTTFKNKEAFANDEALQTLWETHDSHALDQADIVMAGVS